MALKTTNEQFNEVFGEHKSFTEKFKELLTNYLNAQPNVSPFSDIKSALENGEELSIFVCRYDVADKMLKAMIKSGIPCIIAITPNSKVGFISLKEKNNDICKQQQEVLLTETKYRRTETMTVKQLKESITGKTNTVIVLDNLSEAEAYMMREEARRLLDVETVGIDEMADGTFRFAVKSTDVMKRGNKSGMTIAQIYVKVQALLHSELGIALARQMRDLRRFERLVGMNYDVEGINYGKPIYIIGDGNEYVRITGKGFDFGHFREFDGRQEYTPEVSCIAEEPSYFANLISYSGRLVHPTVCLDGMELTDALNYSRPVLVHRTIKADLAFDALLSRTAAMIDRKKDMSPILEQAGNYDEKFVEMVNKSIDIANVASNGGILYEYSETELNDLKNSAEHVGLNLGKIAGSLKKIDAKAILLETRDIKPYEDLDKEESKEKGSKTVTREEIGF